MNAERVHHVGYPLYDTPVTLTMSREQLQIVQDVLRGELNTSKAKWRDYIAKEFEKVLRESLASASVDWHDCPCGESIAEPDSPFGAAMLAEWRKRHAHHHHPSDSEQGGS